MLRQQAGVESDGVERRTGINQNTDVRSMFLCFLGVGESGVGGPGVAVWMVCVSHSPGESLSAVTHTANPNLYARVVQRWH